MHPITDPQLVEGLAGFEQAIPGGINLDDIPATRQFLDNMIAAMVAEAPDIEGVVSSDHYAPGSDGAPEVMVRIYQPEKRPDILPALLWIHGGGYVLGSVEGDEPEGERLDACFKLRGSLCGISTCTGAYFSRTCGRLL